MINKDNLISGKRPLDAASYAADLSGKDFEGVYLRSPQTLSHSFLNGSSFKNSAFLGAPIDQTELAEAHISHCFFEDTDFTGSSFIGAMIGDSTFRNCVFADGEWRKSKFTNVTFQDCDFNYTTLNLCIFDRCHFRGEKTKQLDNRSVNYNVFTRSQFDALWEDDAVLASNFGLPSKGQRKSLTNKSAKISLEEICIKSSASVIVVSELVSAIENEFKRQDIHRLKSTRLEFISNMIAALARTKRISATSLTYLETFFLTLGKKASLEADALAAMSVVINLRSLLFDLIRESAVDSEMTDCICQAIEIRYERSYSEPDSAELAEILGELANSNPKTFAVSRFAQGSTLIELIALQVVSVGAVLTALNFVLRQVNTTLVRALEVRKNAAKLLGPPSRGSKKPRKKPVPRRISALQSPESSKEGFSLHQTIAAHGYHVVLLDDEAQTTVHYLSNK
jgi:uncharacterized protein YjbI with pentapeptide repeats